MRRLKIAIFESVRFVPGGGQKVIPDVARHLSEKHDVTLFTPVITDKKLDFGKAKIKLMSPKWRYTIPFAFLFFKLRGNYDLIIFGCFPSTLARLRNQKIPGIHISHAPPRYFNDLRGEMLSKANLFGKIKIYAREIMFRKLEKKAVKKMNRILAISYEIKKRIKKYYGKNSEVFYPGVNPEKYPEGKYEKYILAPGRVVFNKRPEIIVEAMKFIKNKEIKVIMVGGGDLSESVIKKAREVKNFEFKGFVSNEELKKLYSNCLAVIYIPINEDYGYIPVEAAASGKATIGSNEGGLKETVLNGKTGVLIDKVTPQKLAEKIDYFADNKKIAIKMGMEAKIYSERFHLDNTLNVLDRTVSEVMIKND